MKAKKAADVRRFTDIPNVGPAMTRDFKALGIALPQDLKKADGKKLYDTLCRLEGRQDPCVLDTYLAVVDFMRGAKAKPWWAYTAGRKKKYPDI